MFVLILVPAGASGKNETAGHHGFESAGALQDWFPEHDPPLPAARVTCTTARTCATLSCSCEPTILKLTSPAVFSPDQLLPLLNHLNIVALVIVNEELEAPLRSEIFTEQVLEVLFAAEHSKVYVPPFETLLDEHTGSLATQPV